jgi:hypothetical protein
MAKPRPFSGFGQERVFRGVRLTTCHVLAAKR